MEGGGDVEFLCKFDSQNSNVLVCDFYMQAS